MVYINRIYSGKYVIKKRNQQPPQSNNKHYLLQIESLPFNPKILNKNVMFIDKNTSNTIEVQCEFFLYNMFQTRYIYVHTVHIFPNVIIPCRSPHCTSDTLLHTCK